MIPRDILKKIRQIEIRTNRIVTETLAGQYHSVFKGQGMNFDEVREYQAGDDVRAIDWNVTARMNHPFIKKFVEERELTLMLVVDVSGSGLFGSRDQSKRELAAEIASVLAFSAIRNSDKVGLILFTEGVEKFIPPRKGRKHVLRVIREILFYEPKRRGTDLNGALEFLTRVLRHRSIAVILSDFLGQTAPTRPQIEAHLRRKAVLSETLGQASFTTLRQANRKHDVVAVLAEHVGVAAAAEDRVAALLAEEDVVGLLTQVPRSGVDELQLPLDAKRCALRRIELDGHDQPCTHPARHLRIHRRSLV